MGIAPELSAAQERLKSLDLNVEEVGKFEKAFKDPEFIKLFSEYVNEIKDPLVKAETDQYLRQIEMEGRAEEVYGKGVQLITPEEAVVFKTMNSRNGQKVFINVCTSAKVAAATTRTEPGKHGLHVDLPLSLGPAKIASDKSGAPCSVWDFVIHPDTLLMAMGKLAIRDMLAESAMEKIESVALDIKLDRKYKVPRMKYKVSEGATKWVRGVLLVCCATAMPLFESAGHEV